MWSLLTKTYHRYVFLARMPFVFVPLSAETFFESEADPGVVGPQLHQHHHEHLRPPGHHRKGRVRCRHEPGPQPAGLGRRVRVAEKLKTAAKRSLCGCDSRKYGVTYSTRTICIPYHLRFCIINGIYRRLNKLVNSSLPLYTSL